MVIVLILDENYSHYNSGMRTPPSIRVSASLVVILSVILLVVAACRGGTADDSEGISIVVTTNILGDIVENVVGDSAKVEVLMPIGADPHDFQASAQQVASLTTADLVVANGLGLEEGLESVLRSAESDGANILYVGPQLDPIALGDTQDPDEVDEHHGGDDPHVWLDPVRMLTAVDLVVSALNEVDDGTDWVTRAEEYKEEITIADREIRAMLETVPVNSRKLVTNHDSLGYFADRYGFRVIGVVIPGGSTLSEPSSEGLTALVDVIRAENVKAIFAESTMSDVLAKTVADELGQDVAVIELFTGSLGPTGAAADTYLGVLRENAMRITQGLTG